MNRKTSDLNNILFSSAIFLLVFLCLDQALVMASFLSSVKLLPAAFPLSIVILLLLLFLLEKTMNTRGKLWTAGISIVSIFIAYLAAAFYFDLSWDGQWYHQSAIYHMVQDWNPLTEPIREFEKNNASSISHFPKASWYFAASVYSTFGNFEAGKSMNFILLIASVFLFYSTLVKLYLNRIKSITVTVLAHLNPVIWSEITTYLVDGNLVLYLGIYILVLFAWFRLREKRYLVVGLLAVAGMIDAKFTGLVFFCVLALGGAIFTFIFYRDQLLKYIGIHALAVVFGVVIMGYNPYITNLVERGHPFYPIMGTEKYPSVFERTGKDSNEIYETPHNMMGKPVLVRMFYANFSRPDNAPYYKEKDAELTWPFVSRISDWSAYHFHETRNSGFGPFFSGIIIFSVALSIVLFIREKDKRWLLILITASLFGSLLFSKHFWWPRFGPQMYLIPLVPVVLLLKSKVSKPVRVMLWICISIAVANGSIVLYEHMDWETRSSKQLRAQLHEIQESGEPIDIFSGYFRKSLEEKLGVYSIQYQEVTRQTVKEGTFTRLVSVVEGYPNMVMYRVQLPAEVKNPEAGVSVSE